MEKKIDRREKYLREKARRFALRLNKETEADLIAHLEAQPSMQGYLKRLIREDIKRNEEEEKTMDKYLITMDSFGDTCPDNWEEIASALNAIIRERYEQIVTVDELGIPQIDEDEMRTFVDDLWETWCMDGMDGVPAPVFDEIKRSEEEE